MGPGSLTEKSRSRGGRRKVKETSVYPPVKAYAMGKRKEKLPPVSEEKIPNAERRGKAKNVKT